MNEEYKKKKVMDIDGIHDDASQGLKIANHSQRNQYSVYE
jgi:hypothetical protein